jgi:hypothetical protein
MVINRGNGKKLRKSAPVPQCNNGMVINKENPKKLGAKSAPVPQCNSEMVTNGGKPKKLEKKSAPLP